MGLTLLSTQSFSYESSIVLRPGAAMIAKLDPYDIYEILVPVDSLNVGQTYMIVSSWNGGQSQDVLIKRKRLEYDSNGLYDQSDFKKRKSHAFARKALKDSRPSSDF